MASIQTITDIVNLLFAAPLANAPKNDAVTLTATTGVFAVALQDIEDNLLKAAAVQHIATSKWFPSVADLRETAVSIMRRADDTPDAYTAWGQVKACLRSGRQPQGTALKAINALGGMREYGASDVDDEGQWRARFISAYQVYQNRETEEAMTPPAITAYIEKRRELGGQSVSGLIGGVTKQLMVSK